MFPTFHQWTERKARSGSRGLKPWITGSCESVGVINDASGRLVVKEPSRLCRGRVWLVTLVVCSFRPMRTDLICNSPAVAQLAPRSPPPGLVLGSGGSAQLFRISGGCNGTGCVAGEVAGEG